MVIPEVYAVGTATEAESAYKGVEAGGGISYDAAYNKGDYVVAVGAGHGASPRTVSMASACA